MTHDPRLHDLGAEKALIGASMSAPYFHDGSAASLRAVLLDNGTVHDMADVSDMDPRELELPFTS